MRRLSEAQPSLAEAGWGGARRSARIAGGDTPEGIRTALFSNPTFCERAAPTARNAQASWIGALTSARGRSRATPHPASPKLTSFAKAPHPSPARGEGEH